MHVLNVNTISVCMLKCDITYQCCYFSIMYFNITDKNEVLKVCKWLSDLKRKKKIARGNRKFHASSFSKYESIKKKKKLYIERRVTTFVERQLIYKAWNKKA